MASTNITLHAKAVNKTGSVFADVAKSVKGIGVAFAGAAGVGMAAFAKGVSDLGKLSDIAQKAGASTESITRLSEALGMLGVASSSPEQVANAFARMQATTGQVGEEGFKNVVSQIGELPTAMERAQAATAVFGKSGRDLIPVIEAVAQNGIGAFESIAAAMPEVSQGAADAGDAVADSFGIMTAGAKNLWLNAVGEISKVIDGAFDGGIRAAAMRGAAYMEYFAKRAWRSVTYTVGHFPEVFMEWGDFMARFFGSLGTLVWDWVKSVGNLFANLGEQIWNWLNGDSFDAAKLLENVKFSDPLKEFKAEVGKAWEDMELIPPEAYADLDAKLAESIERANVAAANVAKAAIPANVSAIAEKAEKAMQKGGSASRSAGASSNAFVAGGSYAAMTASLRAAMSKDDAVKEQRKGNGILDKIRTACESTADSFSNIGVLEAF